MFGAPGISAQDRERPIGLATEIHALPAWREPPQTRGWDDAFLTGGASAGAIRRYGAATQAVLRDIGPIREGWSRPAVPAAVGHTRRDGAVKTGMKSRRIPVEQHGAARAQAFQVWDEAAGIARTA